MNEFNIPTNNSGSSEKEFKELSSDNLRKMEKRQKNVPDYAETFLENASLPSAYLVLLAGKTRVRFDPMELASFIETLLVDNSLLIKEVQRLRSVVTELLKEENATT